jgi:thiol-disulfide isomerase/thioredoxin
VRNVLGWVLAAILLFVTAATSAPVSAQDTSGAADDARFVARDPKFGLKLKYDAPTEVKIRVLDAPNYQLTKHLGKVVFFNIFATWCPPCRAEMPALIAFNAAHADDTEIVGIDVGENDDTVRAFRKQFGVPYTIAMDPGQRYFGHIAKTEEYPVTLVIRPDGTLFAAWAGSRPRYWFETARRKAIATSAPAASPAP